MEKDEYKKYIIDMIQEIDNIEYLNRILNLVQKYFVRKTEK